MTAVFYFPRYSQRENFITNNTLLLFHRLYDSNRRRFQRFLAHVLEEKADAPITQLGLRISQQVGIRRSVLDGFLEQSAIRIALETKRAGIGFDLHQLGAHLEAFDTGTSGYLLLLRPTKVDLGQPEFQELQQDAVRKNVLVASITFEDVIASFRSCLMAHDEEMHELIDDFEAFCSEENLLNTDDATIFVPPCGQSFAINVQYRMYFCPAEWTRRRVKYLGIYKDKSVRHIGTIDKLLRCTYGPDERLACQDDRGAAVQVSEEQSARIIAAMDAANGQNGWDISQEYQFFLSDQLTGTDYKKVSPGGIMGHRYLLIDELMDREIGLTELADLLRTKVWE